MSAKLYTDTNWQSPIIMQSSNGKNGVLINASGLTLAAALLSQHEEDCQLPKDFKVLLDLIVCRLKIKQN